MEKAKPFIDSQPVATPKDALTEILRIGAQKMLAAALEAEVAAYLAQHESARDESGRRQVVRNGHCPPREIQTGVGPVEVARPRVDDRRVGPDGDRIRFTSKVLPPYLRRTKSIEELIPWLYLKGVSTGAFSEALAALVGQDAPGLSASTVVRLKSTWEGDFKEWNRRDPKKLIAAVKRPDRVLGLAGQVATEIAKMRAVAVADQAPNEWPGPRCKGSRIGTAGNRPSTCGHLAREGECGKDLPPYWAGSLPNLKGSKARYIANTRNLPIDRLDPADPEMKWTDDQKRVIRAVGKKGPEIEGKDLRRELDKVQWPVAYVDFEFDPGMGIPRFEGTRPYDRIPFQWAMTIQPEPDAPLGEVQSFLWLDDGDPRRAFAESLLEALPVGGSIVAHHAPAENTVLKQLAARLGQPLATRLLDLERRFLDTKEIASAGYYQPDQHGSYSIKKLAPALVGKGYGDLAIQNGMEAVSQWRRACAPDSDPQQRATLARDLERYCGQDALLMHEILEELRSISRAA